MMRMRAGAPESRFSGISAEVAITCTSVQESPCPLGGEDHYWVGREGRQHLFGSLFLGPSKSRSFLGVGGMTVRNGLIWQHFFYKSQQVRRRQSTAQALRCNRICCNRPRRQR